LGRLYDKLGIFDAPTPEAEEGRRVDIGEEGDLHLERGVE